MAQRVVANVDINVQTSSALNKGGACKNVWFRPVGDMGARQMCGSKFVGGMEFEPAILRSCSLGCMVLGTCGCVAPCCIPLDAHSNKTRRPPSSNSLAMLMVMTSLFGRCFSVIQQDPMEVSLQQRTCVIGELCSFAMFCPLHVALSGGFLNTNVFACNHV